MSEAKVDLKLLGLARAGICTSAPPCPVLSDESIPSALTSPCLIPNPHLISPFHIVFLHMTDLS